jgi:hypothetical protein
MKSSVLFDYCNQMNPVLIDYPTRMRNPALQSKSLYSVFRCFIKFGASRLVKMIEW